MSTVESGGWDDLATPHNLAAVSEGYCPIGHGKLVHHELYSDCGWCYKCDKGWSVRGDTIEVQFAARGFRP